MSRTPDPRFHRFAGPFALSDLAARIDAPSPETGADRIVRAVASLEAAGPEDLAFLADRRHVAQAQASAAGVILVASAVAEKIPATAVAWVTPQPALHFARAAAALHPPAAVVSGVDPTARIDAAATVDPSAQIGAYVVVAAGAEIGPDCVLEPHVVIGPGVVLGAGCRIGAGCSIQCARLGARVSILPGARIGQAGFGYTPGPRGLEPTPQLGCVVIGDDAEIGANVTIDRGALSDTVIGRGAKIDNLVQIGHNVRVGAHAAIAAQTGISGSAVIGDGALLGGQVGVSDHITVGPGARIAAQSGLHRDVPAGETWGGYPAVPVSHWRRQAAYLALKTKR